MAKKGIEFQRILNILPLHLITVSYSVLVEIYILSVAILNFLNSMFSKFDGYRSSGFLFSAVYRHRLHTDTYRQTLGKKTLFWVLIRTLRSPIYILVVYVFSQYYSTYDKSKSQSSLKFIQFQIYDDVSLLFFCLKL